MSYLCTENIIKMKATLTQAVLSNNQDMTIFRSRDQEIRFRAPSVLKKYTEVKEWNDGYLVVMADYGNLGIVEEYIDLIPILKNLYIDPKKFLKNIKNVIIDDHEE